MLDHKINCMRLLTEETTLRQQIATCEAFLMKVFDFTNRKGYLVPPLAIEEAVIAIHRIESNLRTELVYLRLEMALMCFADDEEEGE